ncbi:MAG: DUF1697 domain-containing protein [Bacillota bacterium]|nr:DUF1697 domain-containing protein [Bacillota bacterium]
MKKYVALLRGINVSGKNKIGMAELKKAMLDVGYSSVKTYLNSGNVLFCSNKSKEELSLRIHELIVAHFGLDIPVLVEELSIIKDALSHAPSWWGSENKEIYDNLIFVFPETTPEHIYSLIGDPTEGLEQIEMYNQFIFWSFDLKKHAKANWWKKTAAPGIGEYLTIRTANTVRKLVEMGL